MRAIDVHVHVPLEPGVSETWLDEEERRYFKAPPPPTVEEMYQRYVDLDLFAVIFAVDDETISGVKGSSNDWVASIVAKHPDRFMGFATVDPWKGRMALQEVERAVKELGLKGLKLHPTMQAFFPNDPKFYPLWEKCAELGIPALFHTGHSGRGSGLPGGGGLKLKYAEPIPYIDDVAADFPQLTIIMAHPGWPWQDEQLSVCLHKANVYIDLSGWAPKYFPQSLITYGGSLLQDKVLFGSDYPVLTPDRWLREFDAVVPWKQEVKQKALLENAKRVLKLG